MLPLQAMLGAPIFLLVLFIIILLFIGFAITVFFYIQSVVSEKYKIKIPSYWAIIIGLLCIMCFFIWIDNMTFIN
jgi:hypothetical protein